MSDKEKSTVICHRCRWGAAPGHLTQCNKPGISADSTKQHQQHQTAPNGINPAKWALPSIAAASGHCPHFTPVEVEETGAI